MSFASECVKDGLGVVYKFDVSLDNWASIGYRYSTHAGVDATNVYDPRIIALGPLNRALGFDRVPQSGSFSLALANEDGGADWLVDRTTAGNMIKARGRLYRGIYEVATPTSITWKQLGEFVCTDFPERDVEAVRSTWSDDVLGFLKEAAPTPTLENWDTGEGGFTGTLSASARGELMQAPQYKQRLPLAWGHEWVPCQQLPWAGDAGTAEEGKVCIIVCVTASADVVADNDISQLFCQFREDTRYWDRSDWAHPYYVWPMTIPGAYYVPRTYVIPNTTPPETVTLWARKKSASFTINSKSWKVLWVEVDTSAFYRWTKHAFGLFLANNGTPESLAEDTPPTPYKTLIASSNPVIANPVSRWWVRGYPLSAIASKTSPSQHPADIVTDLVTNYSNGGAANLDATSIARTKTKLISTGVGLLNGDKERGSEQNLKQFLAGLCDSMDLDLFATWAGTLGLVSEAIDYSGLTDTLVAISESRVADFREAVPSREQRWAPYNRITLEDLRRDLPYEPEGHILGPYDTPDTAPPIAPTLRVLNRRMSTKWRTREESRRNPWYYRNASTTVRPRVTFTTDHEALQLELGDWFLLTWTRGLGGPYSSAVFRCEGLTWIPTQEAMVVTGIWYDDLYTAKPYLLDDETLIVRATGSAGRLCNIEDARTMVRFSSGSLITDGVAAGDILLLRDTGQADAVFTRNRAIRVVSVTDAISLEVSVADAADFGAPAGADIAGWTILRGATTYHTAISDPTNYPAGGIMYGKVADIRVDGTFSNAVAANKLLDG